MTEQKQLESIIKDFSNAMLVTHSTTTGLTARPMNIAKFDDDNSIWFVTDRETTKVTEIEKNSTVALTLQDDSRFVSISGLAEITSDRSKVNELWSPAMKLWFPNGPEDANLVALQIVPVTAEFWDNSGILQKLKFAASAAVALATNTAIDAEGQHGQVSL